MIIPDVDYFKTMVSMVESLIVNMDAFKPQIAKCFSMLQFQTADAIDVASKGMPKEWIQFMSKTELRWVLISNPTLKFTLNPDSNFSFLLQVQTEGKYGFTDTLATFRTKDIEMLLTNEGQVELVAYFLNMFNKKTLAFMKDYNEDSEKALFILGERLSRIDD